MENNNGWYLAPLYCSLTPTLIWTGPGQWLQCSRIVTIITNVSLRLTAADWSCLFTISKTIILKLFYTYMSKKSKIVTEYKHQSCQFDDEIIKKKVSLFQSTFRNNSTFMINFFAQPGCKLQVIHNTALDLCYWFINKYLSRTRGKEFQEKVIFILILTCINLSMWKCYLTVKKKTKHWTLTKYFPTSFYIFLN